MLADPTGRRRRSLRRVGRAVAVLFAVWLAALALAGVGLLPGVGIPLASHAGAGSAPPPLDARSPLVAVKGARPALATPAATPRGRPVPASAGPAPSQRRAVARRRGVARARQRMAATVPPAPRRSATAPGQTVASPGRSGTAPGQIRPAKTPRPHPTPQAKPTPEPTATAAPSHGRSGTAPGLSSR